LTRWTVGRIIRQYRQTGTIAAQRVGHCGRPRSLSVQASRHLRRLAVRNPQMTAHNLRHEAGPETSAVSLDTVRRTLRRSGLLTYRPVRCPTLSGKAKYVRLQWAREKQHWDSAKWKTVVFSDETCIEIRKRTSQYIRRASGEPIRDQHTISRGSFCVKVMFWGFITASGPGMLVPIEGTVNAQRYKSLLTDHLVPLQGDEELIFQHDNAPCHKALLVRTFLQEHNIDTLTWPPYSPDMNLIETVWEHLKRKVCSRSHSTRQELIEHTLSVWHEDEDLKETCVRLYDTMTTRVEALRKAKGGYTGY